jgi:TadE-like protein
VRCDLQFYDLSSRAKRRICDLLKLSPITQTLRACDGAEIAEAALVLPLVFTLLLGIIWFGRAFNIYSTIQQAAQQGAISAARNLCATCGNNASTNVVTVISTVMQADNLDPSQIKASANPGLPPCQLPSPPAPPGGTCAAPTDNIWVCSNVQLNPPATQPQPATQAPQCGVVVSFQYPFTFNLLALTPLPSITLSAQAQSRMEN